MRLEKTKFEWSGSNILTSRKKLEGKGAALRIGSKLKVCEKMKFIHRMLDRMSGEDLKRDVCYDDEGFTVIRYEKPEMRVKWAEVGEVFAFKRDLFTMDEVCLGFRRGDTELYVWVSEDDRGFKHFLSHVEQRFNIDPKWFGKVAYPAFQQNLTTLWRSKPL